jgi:hypothetical protein
MVGSTGSFLSRPRSQWGGRDNYNFIVAAAAKRRMGIAVSQAGPLDSPAIRKRSAFREMDDATAQSASHLDEPAPSFLAGGGEMGALMRAFGWTKTPVGPVETWSRTLRMMVSFLLANRFPLLLRWGPHYASIYNDAYRPILGNKHPRSMGQPVSECWSEIWHIDTSFNDGPSTWMEDMFLELNRPGCFPNRSMSTATCGRRSS